MTGPAPTEDSAHTILSNQGWLGEQRHEHMGMMQFVRSNIGPNDLIYTDQATSYQLRHYLCNQKAVSVDVSPEGFESFRCEGFHVLFTGPNDGALTAQGVDARWRAQTLTPSYLRDIYGLSRVDGRAASARHCNIYRGSRKWTFMPSDGISRSSD